MSQWIERINTHPIWGELKSLGLTIDLAVAREGNDAAVIDGLERIRTVLAFCGKRLAATDPILIDPRSLTGLNSQLTAARTELDSYVTDGIASHIISANARADEALLTLPTILTSTTTDDLTIINESISHYRTTLGKYLQEALVTQQTVKNANETNETNIAALATSLAAEQQRLATLVLEYQTQFSTAQDKRASEFSASLADQQTKNAASAAEQQTLFSKDQDARKSDYAAAQISNQEKFATLITDYTQKLKDQDKDFAQKLEVAAKTHEANLAALKLNYEASAQEVLKQVNIRREEVEKLVGVIGNLGVTHGYQKVANLAKWMLFLWQFITVAALGGLIFIAYQMAFPSSTKSIPVTIEMPLSTLATTPKSTAQANPSPTSDSVFYQGLATRIFLSLTFGVFAAYAAKQASHFLEMERKNRKMALELEALGAFIAPLKQEQQEAFRIKIGDRSFGIHDHNSNKPKPDDPVTPYDVLNPKELGEFVVSVAKGLKN
jgi:hypothetical protein